MMTSAVSHYCRSSIGRKHLVAVTGLLLCGFLVSHLLGNFLLLVGSDAFNIYAYKLFALGPLLYVIEGVLGLIFLIHLGLAVNITSENIKARGKYTLRKRTGRGTTIMGATMPLTGVVLLVFVILHLLSLKFGTYYSTNVDGVEMRDIYKTTMEFFASPINTAWYVFAMICAAMHTSHGFSSAFQSLGLNHPKYFKKVKVVGYLYAILIGGGFAFISVWAHLQGA